MLGHSMKILCPFLIFFIAGALGVALPPPTNQPGQKELTEKEVRDGERKLLSRIRKLTFAGKRSGEGYFSADGKMLIYQSERLADNPFYQIFQLDLETGDNKLVSTGTGKTTCSWLHPDGRKALFASSHEDPEAKSKQEAELEFRESGKVRKYSWDYDEEYEIYEKNLETGKLRNLTKAKGYDAEGCYSPDGKLIVFSSNRQAYEGKLSEEKKKIFARDKSYFSDIYLMNADGSNLRRLTDVPGYDGGPFFSGDGSKVCWRRFSENGHQAEIFTMNLDGSSQRQLTALGKMSWAPFFHPSGEYLIFSTNVHGFQNFELYLVDAAGSKEPVRVTYTDGFDGLPCFHPDGKSLAWTSNRGTTRQSQIHLASWNHETALRLLGEAEEISQNKESDETNTLEAKELSVSIEADDARHHVEYLASKELEGRFTGTKGARKASRYVADQFSSYGLEPAGEKEDWFQSFPYTKGVKLGKQNSLAALGEESASYEMDKDWRPIIFSESGKTPARGMVFAGYGLQTPKSGEWPEYDSYVHLDVKEKWVMVLRYLPNGWEKKRRDKFWSHAALRKKAAVARDKGAAGIVFVTGPNAKDRKELVRFVSDSSAGISLASISVADKVADGLFTVAGKDLKETHDALDKGDPAMGFPLKEVSLEAEIELIREKGIGRNTLGWLRAGKEPTKFFLVLGAHVDHVGKGQRGSRAKKKDEGKIHPGADDNASGISILLEIAQLLADLKKRGLLKMNFDLLFAAWSGEEIGLIGSGHYARELEKAVKGHDANASLPLVAYLNLDMVGRYKEKLTLHGTGSGEGWLPIIEKANVPVGLNLNPQKDSHLPTDTTSFYSRGVPILSAFTGLHHDYHLPTDTADKLNYEAAADCGRLLARITIQLLKRDDPITYKSTPAPKNRSRGRLSAYLGTIPDYAESDVKGVLLSGVAKGGPADKAGVRGGDVIIGLSDKKIENVYDYTDVISELRPEKTTPIEVFRKGKKLKLTIVPATRE
tara:strand:- start:664 stop:3645 length:2982 start_codon:yes stop_codon:yes gene_type:complete